jgi:hypothetical protein
MVLVVATNAGALAECSLPNAASIERGAMLDWQPIATAPFDRDLQVSVIERGEIHTLIFPCRRTRGG